MLAEKIGNPIELYASRASSEVACSICGKKIVKNNAILRKGHGRFCSIGCKSEWMRQFTREKNPNWRGGRVIIAGRPCLYIPSHPRANKQGYVYEHIVVMENQIGRPLKWIRHAHRDNEVVHHINGEYTDNRIENLILMTEFDHKSMHSRRKRGRRGAKMEVLFC